MSVNLETSTSATSSNPVLVPKLKKSLQNSSESPWFDWIVDGTKRFEGRLFKGDWSTLQADDVIVFICPKKRELTCKVVSMPRFESFGAAFDALGSALVPIPEVSTADVTKIYEQYFKEEDVRQYGVVAIEVVPLFLEESKL
jgi:ASC-1-like (ASCH) protein